MIASPPLFEPAGSAAASPEPAPDRGEWEARGAELGRAAGNNAWDVGDWILQGESSFEVTYDALEKLTGLEPQTLRLYRSVANRFPVLTRVNTLSFYHHRVVARLEPAEARALLERADREDLSARQLAALVAASRPDPEPAPVPSRSELVADRLKAAIDFRQLLAEVPGADKARVSHERTIAELESLVDHLNRLATLPDADAATDEELRGYRHGRRV